MTWISLMKKIRRLSKSYALPRTHSKSSEMKSALYWSLSKIEMYLSSRNSSLTKWETLLWETISQALSNLVPVPGSTSSNYRMKRLSRLSSTWWLWLWLLTRLSLQRQARTKKWWLLSSSMNPSFHRLLISNHSLLFALPRRTSSSLRPSYRLSKSNSSFRATLWPHRDLSYDTYKDQTAYNKRRKPRKSSALK